MVQFCQHIKKDSKDKNAFEHTINSKPCGEEVTLESGQFHNVKPVFFQVGQTLITRVERHTSTLLYKQTHVHVCVYVVAGNIKEYFRETGRERVRGGESFNIVAYSALISCLEFCWKTVCACSHPFLCLSKRNVKLAS